MRMAFLVSASLLFAIFSNAAPWSDTLQSFLRRGKYEFQSRTFFMATINQGNLVDYYALGSGFGASYETPNWKGFQLTLSAYVWDNLVSSNLAPQVNLINRYEIGLFDITRPEYKGPLARLEHLRLSYQRSHLSLTVGRMILKTPFVNPQDGRMRPNMQEGGWIEWRQSKRWHAQGGILWRMSPRSTEKWYTIAETFGIYPQARAITGRPATYKGNIPKQPLVIGALSYHVGLSTQLQYWFYWMPQMFYTQFLQLEGNIKNGYGQGFWGVQWAWQTDLDARSELSAEKRYMPKNHRAWVMSARIGQRINFHHFTLNYTHIGDAGQWLFPREWGRDPFYTFIPRERNEGFANVHAITFNYQTRLTQTLQLQLSVGNYAVPHPTNALKNKYAMPDYQQLNTSLLWRPQGFWKGLEVELLYMIKNNGGSEPLDDNFIINKVNMHHVNWIVNYRF